MWKMTLEQAFYGEPSFQGTKNYGIGNKRQMATDQDPSVLAIVDQEQLENFDDMLDYLSIQEREPMNGLEEGSARALPSDQYYKNLSGFNQINSLEDLINDYDDIWFDDHQEELAAQRHEQEKEYYNQLEEYKFLSIEEPEEDGMAKPSSNFLANQVDFLDLPTQDETRTGTMSSVVSPKQYVPSLQETYNELF